MITKYQAWKSIRNERASVTYVAHVLAMLKFLGKPLESLDIDDIVVYQAHIKGFAPATQAIHAQALRDFFRFYSKRGGTIDPTEINVPRVEEKVPVYVVQEEFETLCDIAKDSPQVLLAIRLLWFTAVRVSELCDMEVGQCDTRERCAKLSTRKSFKIKQVFWDEETNDILIRHLASYPSSQYVFQGKNGKISTRQVQRWIEWAVKKAGITKEITPHSFRHGATKEFLNAGVDLPAIKDLLGHKHLMSVEKYTKRLDEDIAEKGREAVRRRSAAVKHSVVKLLGG